MKLLSMVDEEEKKHIQREYWERNKEVRKSARNYKRKHLKYLLQEAEKAVQYENPI